MLVLLLLDDLASFLERLLLRAFEIGGALRQQLPVLMVLRLREDDAFAGDELRGRRIAGRLGLLQRGDERLTEAADDVSTRRRLVGVDLELLQNLLQDLDVRIRLLQVSRPLVPQLFGDRAAKRCLVDLDASTLVLERLKQELLELLRVQHG